MLKPASCLTLLLLVLVTAPGGAGQAEPPPLLEAQFQKLKEQYRTNQNDLEVTWKFARACFSLAQELEEDERIAPVAEAGVEACKKLIPKHADAAPLFYYLALNQGQFARTKGLRALRLVKIMEKNLQRARELDPQFDYGGPDRSVGLLYLEVPGWPISIGSEEKARQHLQRAIELGPDYPGNHLALIDAYLRWDEKTLARQQFKTLEKRLPKAREQFKGEDWAVDWANWDREIAELKEELAPEQRDVSPGIDPRQNN